MNTTTKFVIIDPKPWDYLGLAVDRNDGRVQLHLLPTGADALSFASQVAGAVWLINTRLPDMSGVELFGMLRSGVPGAAVVMVSDQYSVQDELQVMSLGSATYACKPLETLTFRSLVAAAQYAANPSDLHEENRMVA